MQLQDHVISNAPAAGPSRCWRAFLWLLLALAVIYFTWRGPVRAAGPGGSGDLPVGYAAGLAWLAGENPYDPGVLSQHLLAAGAGLPGEPDRMEFRRNIYFPLALPMYLPLGILDWTGAKWAWLLLNVAGVVAIGRGLLILAEIRPAEPRAQMLLAMLIALAPVHSTMAMGQTGIIATALVVVAAVLERRQSAVAAGVVYGLAAAMKMQLAFPFLVYVIWKRRWPTAIAGVLVATAIAAISIGRMEMAGVPWYGTWMANLIGTTTGGGHNDASLANPGRHSMLCLSVLLHGFIESRMVVTALTYILVLGAALFTVSRLRGRYPRQELLVLSIVGVLTLLVTYHRTYDGVLMALPLAWAFAAGRSARLPAFAVIVCSLVLLVPGQTLLHQWVLAGRIPAAIARTPFWTSGAAVHQVWALVGVAVALLYAVGRQGGDALQQRPECLPADSRVGNREQT